MFMKIICIISMVIAGASIATAVTDTPKLDTFIGKVYRVLDWLAINVWKAKDKYGYMFSAFGWI